MMTKGVRAIPKKNGGGVYFIDIFFWMDCGILKKFICMGGGVVENILAWVVVLSVNDK